MNVGCEDWRRTDVNDLHITVIMMMTMMTMIFVVCCSHWRAHVVCWRSARRWVMPICSIVFFYILYIFRLCCQHVSSDSHDSDVFMYWYPTFSNVASNPTQHLLLPAFILTRLATASASDSTCMLTLGALQIHVLLLGRVALGTGSGTFGGEFGAPCMVTNGDFTTVPRRGPLPKLLWADLLLLLIIGPINIDINININIIIAVLHLPSETRCPEGFANATRKWKAPRET